MNQPVKKKNQITLSRRKKQQNLISIEQSHLSMQPLQDSENSNWIINKLEMNSAEIQMKRGSANQIQNHMFIEKQSVHAKTEMDDDSRLKHQNHEDWNVWWYLVTSHLKRLMNDSRE